MTNVDPIHSFSQPRDSVLILSAIHRHNIILTMMHTIIYLLRVVYITYEKNCFFRRVMSSIAVSSIFDTALASTLR